MQHGVWWSSRKPRKNGFDYSKLKWELTISELRIASEEAQLAMIYNQLREKKKKILAYIKAVYQIVMYYNSFSGWAWYSKLYVLYGPDYIFGFSTRIWNKQGKLTWKKIPESIKQL